MLHLRWNVYRSLQQNSHFRQQVYQNNLFVLIEQSVELQKLKIKRQKRKQLQKKLILKDFQGDLTLIVVAY